MMHLLAAAGSESANGDLMKILGWVTTFVSMVLTVILVPILKAKWQAQAKTEVVNGPQSFEVRMKEEFVTRREFEKLESAMAGHIVEMKGIVSGTSSEMKVLFEKTMMAVSAQNTSLTNKIDRQNKHQSEEIGKVASGCYSGRQKIWEQVNDSRESIAEIKATSNVAAQLGKLAEALQPQQTKVQPTHPSHG